MWMDRIRQDFHLALVVMFGIISNVMILPFAVYRFSNGQVLAGIIDTMIVTCISIGALHAFRHGSTKRVALFLAAIYSAGCIGIAFVAGPPGPLWLYAVVLSNFLLVERKRAAVISALGIAAVAASSLALPELTHKAAFVSSAVVVCTFAYIFAWRTDVQRRQLEELALLDPLTGASNRRGLNAELEIAMATSSRNGKPLGLIIFDLDHFKRINDRFGHDAGDNVLIQLANVVRRTTRRNDRFFRLGGEEFALLIPDTSPESLRDIAEKVRMAIQREVHCGDTSVTSSLGGSILRVGETAGSWQARADAAMYRAKHGGRNRSVIDEIDPLDPAVAISATKASTAHACTGKPTRVRKGADARSSVASLHAPAPRLSVPRRSHSAALVADSSLPASLASLAGNEDRGLRTPPLAASVLTTLP